MSCLQDKLNNDDILQMITNGIYFTCMSYPPYIRNERRILCDAC